MQQLIFLQEFSIMDGGFCHDRIFMVAPFYSSRQAACFFGLTCINVYCETSLGITLQQATLCEPMSPTQVFAPHMVGWVRWGGGSSGGGVAG